MANFDEDDAYDVFCEAYKKGFLSESSEYTGILSASPSAQAILAGYFTENNIRIYSCIKHVLMSITMVVSDTMALCRHL